MARTIVLGVDDSAGASRATEWCARLARDVGAHVVVVHAIETSIASPFDPYLVYPDLSPDRLVELEDVIARDWCKPLADAGVPFRIRLPKGSPATELVSSAKRENADMIVIGRRGRGAITEAVLGSTSRSLTHRADRPLVIVP